MLLTRLRHLRTVSVFTLICLIILLLTSADAQAGASEASLNGLLDRMTPIDTNQATADATARYLMSEDGYLRHLGAPNGYHFQVSGAKAGNPGETALAFLREHSLLLGIESEGVDFTIFRERERTEGHHVRLRQTYSNIEIISAEVITLLDEEESIESVISDILRDTRPLDDGTVSLSPRLLASDAHDAIRQELEQEVPGVLLQMQSPRLRIFAPSVLDLDGAIRLVWRVRVSSQNAPRLNADILLDAQTGEIVHRFARHYSALDREIYDANNTTALPGNPERFEGDPASGIADVNSAYAFLGDTYNFYSTEHGRDGLDGSGGTMVATTRWCSPDTSVTCPLGNAFWDGSQMKFGQGYATDDVTGHELTHGVTESESGLVYENTSGAINEAFSDIWGEYVDLGNTAGNDAANQRWLIGEDIPGGAIRDMANPPNGGDPDRLGSPNYIPPVSDPDGDNDFGGVHSNSGIVNKLAYLLTDGDSFNGRTITSMGISAVADLFYEAQVNFLTSGPDWSDFAFAIGGSAISLGWSDSDVRNVYCALVAIELLDDAEPPSIAVADTVSTFDPANPWTHEGVVITSLTVTAAEGTHLENVRFLSEPLQCGDVPCETDDHVKIHGDLVEFAPPHIAYLPAGESAEVEVKVTIPIGQHACDYIGHLLMVADVDGICQAQMSDSVEITVEVLPEADMDIDDNHAEVSENKLRMKGAKLTTATGHFTIVNPNSWDQNVDFDDGPGNIRIDPLNLIKSSLKKVGDPTKAIAASAITVGALPSLGSGESADIEVNIDIPDGLPINDFYQGTIEVIYDNCQGGGTVSDIVGVELHLLPTQGTLVILEDSVSGEFCPGSPWTMVGQVTHSFEVMANGDHRNIRVASGGLRHETLDKKLDLFNFYPEEIAFLAAGETRTITVISQIPIGQHSGNYADYFRIVSENGGEDSVHADIDICQVFDLDVLDDYGNVSANVMEIEAIGRANQTGGEWKLRAFDIGIPGELIANNDGFDGPGNTPVDCITCEFDDWSPLWHEDDHDHHFHSNFTFEGSGSVIGDTCSWMSGEFRRMWVSIFVPPIKGGDNHPGTYKGGLRCHAIAAGDTVASDHFDIEVHLARIVGPGNTIQDDGSFGAFPTEDGAVIYWGDFASVGLDGSVTLYRIDNETGVITQVHDAPGSQGSQYVDTAVKEGRSYNYQLEIEAAGKKTAIGPISIGGTPRTFFLAQNAPNPVVNQTMIAYQLPKQGRVSLKVYDINGRLVKTIKDAEETVGFYSVTWDRTNNAGRKAANGIYFYRLESPGVSTTKKMTLVR